MQQPPAFFAATTLHAGYALHELVGPDFDRRQRHRRRRRLLLATLLAAALLFLLTIAINIQPPDSVADRYPEPLAVTLLPAASVTSAERVAAKPDEQTSQRTDVDAEAAASRPESLMPDVAGDAAAQEPVSVDIDTESDRNVAEAPEPPRTTVDWRAVSKQAVQDMGEQQATRERRNAELWWRSGSVMFAASDDSLADAAIEEPPLLPGLKMDGPGFNGLGIPLGNNCFFGIPPSPPEDVDTDDRAPATSGIQRTGVNLFYCGR